VNDPVRTMRAMCAASAEPDSLTCEVVPVPALGPGGLLAEVCATAVPCHDLSGTVAATGRGVSGWRTGDHVYGLAGLDRPGAAAEYVTAPAADLAPEPASVDHLAAAAVPLRRAHGLAGAAPARVAAAWAACPGARRRRRSSGNRWALVRRGHSARTPYATPGICYQNGRRDNV
jgi:NADPH:quinone reductase-like Zn-dependent oxidoreductase